MFAVVSDFDGSNKRRIDLQKFTAKSSLWRSISLSITRLQVAKQDSRKRIFVVFDEKEKELLEALGKRLGLAGYHKAPDAEFITQEVKSVLRLFIEDFRIMLKLARQDTVMPTYFDGCLPAIGIVRSNFVPEGGLP